MVVQWRKAVGGAVGQGGWWRSRARQVVAQWGKAVGVVGSLAPSRKHEDARGLKSATEVHRR